MYMYISLKQCRCCVLAGHHSVSWLFPALPWELGEAVAEGVVVELVAQCTAGVRGLSAGVQPAGWLDTSLSCLPSLLIPLPALHPSSLCLSVGLSVFLPPSLPLPLYPRKSKPFLSTRLQLNKSQHHHSSMLTTTRQPDSMLHMCITEPNTHMLLPTQRWW